MPINDEIINSYVKKILTLKEQNSLKKQDLEHIARDLGLTDEDLKIIEQQVQKHLNKGRGFIKNGFWDEAMKELQEALVLNPFHFDLIYSMALAYKGRFAKTGSKTDRDKSQEFIHQCIEIQPQNESCYFILKELKNVPQKQKNNKLTKQKLLLIGLLFSLVAGAAVILLFIRNGEKEKIEFAKPENENTYNEKMKTWEIPMNYISTEASTGILINSRVSILNNYDDSYSYNFRGDLFSEIYEILFLQLKMELLDKNNSVIKTSYIDALDDHQPYIRPGNVLPIEELIFTEGRMPDITEMRVYIHLIEKEKAPEIYPTLKLEDFSWQVKKSSLLDITIRERENSYSPAGFGPAYHKLTYEVENTGKRSIKLLVLQAEWYNETGNPIKNQSTYVASSSTATFLPGQIRCAYFIGDFNKETGKFTEYQISVIEIE